MNHLLRERKLVGEQDKQGYLVRQVGRRERERDRQRLAYLHHFEIPVCLSCFLKGKTDRDLKELLILRILS
jgi:hypothetical protein